MTDRLEVIICGRKLGTADGWDGDLGEFFWFNDFKPAHEVPLCACESLYIDFVKGLIGTDCTHDIGKLLDAKDLPELLLPLPKVSS